MRGHVFPSHRKNAFTILELLVVVALVVVLTALLVPAMTSLKGSGDINSAAYNVKAIIEQARTFAMANSTYVWIGFFEESYTTPGVAGIGRIVISAVASKDGTQIFDPNSSVSSTNQLFASRLAQLGKLIKIDAAHLADVTDPDPTRTALWDQRPSVTLGTTFVVVYRIGQNAPLTNGSPALTQFPFQYPVGNPAPTAQYTFSKTIQFNPRGEATLNSTYSVAPWLEVGLQPAHGTAVDSHAERNTAAQVAGLTGDVRIYQR